MTWLRLFFSFRGRTSRAGYWTVSITWAVLSGIYIYAWPGPKAPQFIVGRDNAIDLVPFLVALPVIVSCLAIGFTRLHDRNRSGGWCFLFYLAPPIDAIASLNLEPPLVVLLAFLSGVISIWGLVWLGFLPGTHGENAYGSDPLLGNGLRSE